MMKGHVTRRDGLRWCAAGLVATFFPPVRAAGDPPAASSSALKGRIYIPADVGESRPGGGNSIALIAIDLANGERTTILEDCGTRPRISPDGRNIAFEREGWIWIRSVAGGDEPRKVLDLDGASAGSPAVWSKDGKQLIVSPGRRDDAVNHWVFKTFRVNADGSDTTELKIRTEDGVADWSSEKDWLVVTSSRNAKFGWQLYVMHEDGTGERQITEGGNPFYCRISPDGRQVAYADGTSEERRGIWVVGIDGKGRRKVCATGKAQVSPCWSPDGTKLAVTFRHFDGKVGELPEQTVIEVIDLQGKQMSVIDLPKGYAGDMPEWR